MKNTDKLKIGFIGCGRHATKVIYPSLRYAPIDLMAVCDLDERVVRRNSRWFGAQGQFTDHERMLDECELDGVIIVTGPATHARLARDVIERGLPVFIEKPPAYTLDEAEKLLTFSREKKVDVTVGMMKRWAPAYQRVKKITAGKDFGEISHIQASFRVGQKYCSGYALILDAGIHILDMIRFFGGDVEVVHAEKWQGETGLAYAITVRFASGAVGNVHISDQGSWFYSNEAVEITGCGAFVRADNLISVASTSVDGITQTWSPGISIPQNHNNSLFIQGYAPQFQAWAESLRAGSCASTSLEETCRSMRLVQSLEPGEDYTKIPQSFPHWQAEEAWLSVEEK